MFQSPETLLICLPDVFIVKSHTEIAPKEFKSPASLKTYEFLLKGLVAVVFSVEVTV
jgi:hypothetical protein